MTKRQIEIIRQDNEETGFDREVRKAAARLLAKYISRLPIPRGWKEVEG